MSDLTIHNINISYDESDERVRNFIKYLRSESGKEETKASYQKAREDKDNKVYLSDKTGNEFTMICPSEHNCDLRLRGM
jgi:glycosylphosphatidylinositol transamidase (GPIT) subunit GPI8